MTTLVTLIGEQPLPNLLPIRALKPERVILVHTGKGPRGTEPTATRLVKLLGTAQPVPIGVEPYDLLPTCARLRAVIAAGEDVVFNLTGGTKMMALAAYTVAVERHAPVVYFQTERRGSRTCESRLHRYAFVDEQLTLVSTQVVPTLISINDYLRAHLPGYESVGFSKAGGGKLSIGGRFEKAIYEALETMAGERGVDLELVAGVHPQGVSDTLDIDLVVRSGNQVGVVEIKKNPRKGKDAIDQLTTVARREYLGTYTARFVVLGGEVNANHRALFEESKIAVAEMRDYADGQPLSAPDRARLWDALASQIPLASLLNT